VKKYQEETFSVIEQHTGRKICDCADENDALMMVAFDPANRTYTRNQMLMGGVIDIEMPKRLPTNEVVRSVAQPEPLRLVEDDRQPVVT
jgi:hypothetical protein